MHILITGGTGFIGQRLALELLRRNGLEFEDRNAATIERIVLADSQQPAKLAAGLEANDRVAIRLGDVADPDYVASLFAQPVDAVFHLASIVSFHGEQDFDLAYRVNLDGARLLFDALRRQQNGARLVFASSIAAFGGDAMPATVSDLTKLTPTTSYGTTKAICELLVNDYSRKGFFDGRSARLPTVIVRPGKPNKAASSFASGLYREPLAGEPCIIPVEPDQPMPVIGYRAVVGGLIRLAELPAEKLGSDRGVGLPALNPRVDEMVAALKNATGERFDGLHRFELDPAIAAICRGWPVAVDGARGLELGLPLEQDLEEIVRYYIEDYIA